MVFLLSNLLTPIQAWEISIVQWTMSSLCSPAPWLFFLSAASVILVHSSGIWQHGANTELSIYSSFAIVQQQEHHYIYFLFLCIFRFFVWILSTSATPQRPAHGTVSSKMATHLRTDRVCRVLGRSWIEPRTTESQSGALPLSHLSSFASSYIYILVQWLCSPNSLMRACRLK